MTWSEVFIAFTISHLVGDFLLQTESDAARKYGGLTRDRVRRNALLSHVATYTLAFVPALVWIGTEIGVAGALGLAALIAVPHLVQDDGRLLTAYVRRVKRSDLAPGDLVFVATDQSFHAVALLGAALLAVI